MKNIDFKSLLLGVFITTTGVLFLNSKPADDDALEVTGTPGGVAVFNKQTNTLYLYPMMVGKLKDTPSQVLQVSIDGSEMKKIK